MWEQVGSQIRRRLRCPKMLTKILTLLSAFRKVRNWSVAWVQIIGRPFRENCTQYVRTSSSGKMSHTMQLVINKKGLKKALGFCKHAFKKILSRHEKTKKYSAKNCTLCLKSSVTLFKKSKKPHLRLPPHWKIQNLWVCKYFKHLTDATSCLLKLLLKILGETFLLQQRNVKTTKLCTHIILHSEAETSELSNDKPNTFLSRGGSKAFNYQTLSSGGLEKWVLGLQLRPVVSWNLCQLQ